MNERLTGGSLFSGTGGLDLAVMWLFHDLGIDLRFTWDSDIKPAAKTFLAHRRPHAPNLGDIHDIATPLVDTPPVDVLTFGWPCQPHSAAGKRLGEADPRALWPEVLRVIRELRPTYLFGENVSRVAGNGELRRVVQALAEVGYVGAWRCVRAGDPDVGAPHRRDRLFLLACRADALGPVADTFGDMRRSGVPESRTGTSTPGLGPSQPGGRDSSAPDLTLLPSPTARLGASGSVTRECAEARAARRPNGPNLDDAIALLPTPAVADARNTRNATAERTPENDRHHSGWTLSDVAYADRWGRYTDAIARWERSTGRPAPDAVLASTKTGQLQLSAAFVEWMMGLPAGWVTDVPGLTRAQQLSMLGDGVVPQQARHAYGLLLEDLTATTGRSAA